MTTYRTIIGEREEHEFRDRHGHRALVRLTVTTEHDEDWPGPEHTIDPALAEVWPCIARPMGHSAYALDALTGDALTAWLHEHHDELVELALDVAQAQRERHDEEMAER